MTDIDAIRKRDDRCQLDLISPHPWQMATSCSFRRVLDAQGREIIGGTVQRSDNHPDIHFANGGYEGPDAALLIEAPQIAADRRELRHAYDAKCEELAIALASCTRLGNDREKFLAERDALRKYETYFKTLTPPSEQEVIERIKAEAERDAAVRDAARYRWLRDHWDEPCVQKLHPWDEFSPDPDQLDAQIDAQLAALAPPTEQTKQHTRIPKGGGLSCEGATRADDRGDRATEETGSDRPAAPISKPVTP